MRFNITNIKMTVKRKKIINLIKQNKIFRETQVNREFELPEDTVEAYLELLKYYQWFTFRVELRQELITYFEKRSKLDKNDIELIKLDKSKFLAGYFLSLHYDDAQIINFFRSSSLTVREFAYVLIIEHHKLCLNLKFDNNLLYKYFVHNTLSISELSHYQSDVVSYILMELNKKKQPILNKVIENLILLVDKNIINVMEHKQFFIDLFKYRDYLFEVHFKLFCKIVGKHNSVIVDIINSKLCIDPFTKQVNYSLWLKDVQKFLFVKKLIGMCNGKIECSADIGKFQATCDEFFKLYQYDDVIL